MELAIVIGVGLGLAAFDAWAGTDHGGPFDPALLGAYAWVLGIAMLGGLAQFYRKVRMGQARAFNFAELIGELVISAFAGVITFWLCKSTGLNAWLTAAFVGISGHMGSRAIFMGEQVLESWYGRIVGPMPQSMRVPVDESRPSEDVH